MSMKENKCVTSGVVWELSAGPAGAAVCAQQRSTAGRAAAAFGERGRARGSAQLEMREPLEKSIGREETNFLKY